MKKLVAYFSATGTTKILAQNISKVVKGDLFEIKPLRPYSKQDLDWTNGMSRSSLEMKDLSSRPAIAEKLNNMNEYDTIYLGFPIWWYVAPTIINTFLEQYDLTGKIIIPFATSGGSSMGDTNKHLQKSCNGAVLKEGKRFSTKATIDDIKKWVKSL